MTNLTKFKQRVERRKENLRVIKDTLKEQIKEIELLLSEIEVTNGYKSDVEFTIVERLTGKEFSVSLKIIAGKVTIVGSWNTYFKLSDYLRDTLRDTADKYLIEWNSFAPAWKDFVENHLSKLNTLKKAREILEPDYIREAIDIPEELPEIPEAEYGIIEELAEELS